MVQRALKHLGKQKPLVSLRNLSSYLMAHYPVGASVFRTYLSRALQKCVENKTIVKVRQSFQLPRASSSKSLKAKQQRMAKKKQQAHSMCTKKVQAARSVPPAVNPIQIAQMPPAALLQQSHMAAFCQQQQQPVQLQQQQLPAPLFQPPMFVPLFQLQQPAPQPPQQQQQQPPAKPLGLKYDHLWQYYDNGWVNYDTKASDVVEEVYLNYLANCGDNDVRAVKSGQWEYMVDFMALKQTNIQHANHTLREIRRVSCSLNTSNQLL